MASRWQRSHHIEQLDPVQDHVEIARLLAGYEFPWDITRALEIALFRTFCVPSVSQLLDRTGEFQHRPQKRYDDTGLIVSEILKWGYDSEPGAAAIARMNHIHGHFPISNEDFRYVLSTFIYEPIRWIERFGWRSLSITEKQALFYFWQAVGDRMNIHEIPETYASFEQFNQAYEQQHFRYSDSNRRVGDATLSMLVGWFPKPLQPAVRPSVYVLLDDSMRRAFGYPTPPEELCWAIAQTLRFRGWMMRSLPPRTTPDFFVDSTLRSYPHGFTLADVGPPSMRSRLNAPPVPAPESEVDVGD